MNIKSSYEKLYQHWLKESNQKDITALNQALYEEYSQLVSDVNNIEKDNKQNLQNKILISYQENFTYLITDLLKMREIKLLNPA